LHTLNANIYTSLFTVIVANRYTLLYAQPFILFYSTYLDNSIPFLMLPYTISGEIVIQF